MALCATSCFYTRLLAQVGRSSRCLPLRKSSELAPLAIAHGLHRGRTPIRWTAPLASARGLHRGSVLLHPTVPFVLSDIGEGIVDVVVKEWYVKEGDRVAQLDPVCEVQSDKASVTITSRYDGHVAKIHYQVDQVAKVGQPLLDITVPDGKEEVATTGASSATMPTRPSEPQSPEGDRFLTDKALATPAVRRIARENQVDLSKVPATGKAGRVLKEDIVSFLGEKARVADVDASPKVDATLAARHADPVPGQTDRSLAGKDWTLDITGVKKAMAKTMTEAWKIPHFSYSDELDVTELMKFRKQARLDAKAGVNVTYLPFLLKAVSLALQSHPHLNAQVDGACTQLTVRADHNLGVAMDTPSGLLVPSVKRVQRLGVVEIAQELARLQDLARRGRLAREDLADGTLTLSNIGAIGGVHAMPILLPPQIVIGALGKIQRLPRYDDDDALVPRQVMMVSWSADHRAVDGAAIAKFSNLFKLYVSTPKLLLQL